MGLNSSVKLLPEYLQEGGYATHMVGKWHLGYCNAAYLPTRRGFLSFFGQYCHSVDYYTKYTSGMNNHGVGYDLHDNEEITYEGNREFSTDLYTRKAVDIIANHDTTKTTKPLFLYLSYQAPHAPLRTPPEKYKSLYRGKPDKNFNLKKAATISALDAGVGRVYDALREFGLYENSVLVFTTDNGGYNTPGRTDANFPLAGHKRQHLEGGVRGVGFVNSPLLAAKGRTSNRLLFITDWFSTILNLAGMEDRVPEDTDSFPMWDTIAEDKASPRSEIIFTIDQNVYEETWSAVILKNGYKLIWGQESILRWDIPDKSCNTKLYKISHDPTESTNLAHWKDHKRRVGNMKKTIMDVFRSSRFLEPDYPRLDSRGFPANNDGLIATGWCQLPSLDLTERAHYKHDSV